MLSVEKGQSSGPPKPEPTLSCVQCGLDYKESRNAGTHPGLVYLFLLC